MFKKFLTVLLSIFLVLPIFGKTNFIFADDDEDETVEKSDRDKCIEDKDEDACIAVAKNAKNDLDDIEKRINEAQNNQQEALELAKEYAEKAAGYQADIDELEVQITELKKRIVELEKQIEENETKVEELNGRVKDRMVAYQKTMHFNGYLEFILGSKSFTDMLRRIYGVKAVSSKDKADREEYLEIINKLNSDKKELDDAKRLLMKAMMS